MTPGHYVYGVVEAGSLARPPGAPGIDPTQTVGFFEAGGLTAVTSVVDVDEFDGAELERNLASPEWLERKVRAHEGVLDEIVPLTSVVPMRFGSIFSTAEGLRTMLVEHGPALHDALVGVRGCKEWGLRVHCDQRVLAGSLAGTGSEPASGRAYLMRKKAELEVEAVAAEAAERVAAGVHEALASLSEGAVLTPPRVPGAVLAAAYLVRGEARESFMGRVEELQSTHGDAFVFEVTGPWPPYNFTRADVSGPA